MLDAPQNAPIIARKARPTELAISGAIGDPAITLGLAGVITSPYTPTRGSTPTAFKFLQPKRKLIEPNQVLSVDEDDMVSNFDEIVWKYIHIVGHTFSRVPLLFWV